MNADQPTNEIPRPERRIVYLSYENYCQAESEGSITSDKGLFNFDGKKLFSTRKAVTVDGMLVVVDGKLWASFDTSHCWAYKLVPVETYTGPTYMIPAHEACGPYNDVVTLPDGNVRHRGIDTGMLCLVDGKKMVFADALLLKAKLPSSVLDVTRKDIENADPSKLSLSHGSWDDAPREWIDYKGIPVQVQTASNGNKRFFVYGRNRRGIFDIMLERLDLVDELLASKPAKRQVNLEVAEQLSFF